MVAALHEAYPIKLTYGGGPTTLYANQLDNVEVSAGIEALIARAAGALAPQAIATAQTENKVSFTSADAATLLGALSFSTGLILATATLQWEKRTSGGGYASGSNHITMTSTGGLVYPKELSAKQGDKEGAKLALDYCPFWDGTNLPLVVNASQALAGTPAANAIHALGPVIFEGAQLLGVQSVSCKSGIEVKAYFADGELYPRTFTINAINPMIEIELNNLGLASTLTLGTTTALSTGSICYFQKVVPGGGRVAIGTAEHISIAATAGAYRLDSISGSKGEHANLKLTIMPAQVLAMNAATAITIP